jgi:hypothetical protein
MEKERICAQRRAAQVVIDSVQQPWHWGEQGKARRTRLRLVASSYFLSDVVLQRKICIYLGKVGAMI